MRIANIPANVTPASTVNFNISPTISKAIPFCPHGLFATVAVATVKIPAKTKVSVPAYAATLPELYVNVPRTPLRKSARMPAM
jgi:hypothetical protein